jgi:MFS family permease
MPPHRVTTALSAFASGAAGGAAISIGVGGFLVAYATAHAPISVPLVGALASWQFVFLVTGLPGLLLGLLIFVVPEPARRAAPTGIKSALAPFLRRHGRFLLCHNGGFAMVQLIAFASSSWSAAYLMRVFGWKITDVGMLLGAEALLTMPSAVAMGWLVDRWFQAGRLDAHLRFYILVVPVVTLLLALAFAMPGPVLFIAFHAVATCMLPMAGIASGALQIATPGLLRGRISALFLFVNTMVGLSLGPALPGVLSDLLFDSDKMIGWGVVLTCMIAAPLAVGLLLLGREPMRRAVTENGFTSN